METVKRISPQVRSAANYHTSLEVIRQIAESGITAKSGITGCVWVKLLLK